MSASKIALVTGANKGIGFSIVKSLSANPGLQVLLGSRSVENGKAAVEALQRKNVTLLPLDIDDEKSIAEAARLVKEKYHGVDILVNNAAIAFKGDAFDENVARTTNHTNYYGTLHMLDHFLPLVREGGRVVNVSSQASQSALSKMSEDLRSQYLADDLTIERLTALQEKFIKDVAENQWEQRGWPKSAYGVSKVGVSMLTRIKAHDWKGPRDVLMNAVCPGWVKTDMSSQRGVREPDFAAEQVLHLALLPKGGPNGVFFFDKEVIPWVAANFRTGRDQK